MNLRLTIPDPRDNLVMYTDASKVAASACFIREKRWEIRACVPVNSKHFSTTDLNKCSYILESIALAFALKSYAAYLLNCEAEERRSLSYTLERVEHELKLTKEVIESVDPYDIRINNIEIRILGDNESRVKTTNELLEFEDEITECYSSQIEKKLPFVQKFTEEKYIHDEDKEEEINDEDLDRLLKAESDDSLVALLAAELHESKRFHWKP